MLMNFYPLRHFIHHHFILDSGVKPEYVFKVGSPMAEILSEYLENINQSNVLERLGLEEGKYILLSETSSFVIDPIVNTPESTASGRSVEVLTETAGNLKYAKQTLYLLWGQ